MLLNEESDRMLQEMRDSGELCCIDISSDFNYVWDVSFCRYDSEVHEHTKAFGSFEDLNKAIKATYDIWKGVRTEDIFKWCNTLQSSHIKVTQDSGC